MLGLFGSEWQAGNNNERFITLCGSDLVIHPDHRGQGLFKPLWDEALSHLKSGPYRYLFVLSGNSHSTRITLKNGWKQIGSLIKVTWMAEKTLTRKVRKFARRFSLNSQDHSDPFSYFDELIQKELAKGKSSHLSDEPNIGAMVNLLRRIGQDGRIQHVRDERYYSYRFQNPLSAYRFLYWGENEIDGYIVLQTSHQASSNHSWVNILDWEAKSEKIRRKLLNKVLKSGAFDEINIWAATLREESKQTLRDAGFNFNGSGEEESYPTILVRAVPEELQTAEWRINGLNLLDLNNWSIRGVFSDGY
jgi:hypothetical protein